MATNGNPTDGTSFPERVLADAVGRLKSWIERGDYGVPTALADALNALYMIEERSKRRLGTDDYKARRDQHTDGPLVVGLVWVRGRMVHSTDEGNVAGLVGARPFTLGRSTLGGGDTVGGLGVQAVWQPLNARPGDQELAAYNAVILGQEVTGTIETATRFFRSL